jgi:hypothetical protein
MVGRRAVVGAALTALIAPATLIATQAPALAHYAKVSQGSDYAVVYSDHFSGAVCDKERDGHSVYGQWFNGVQTFTEADGGDAGCDTISWSNAAAREFRVCEKIAGRKDPCSPWVAA